MSVTPPAGKEWTLVTRETVLFVYTRVAMHRTKLYRDPDIASAVVLPWALK